MSKSSNGHQSAYSTVEIRDSDVIRQSGELDSVVVWGAQNVSKTILAILLLSDH